MATIETAKASIGIKILLSDLLLQINESNFNLIKEILNSGYVEDDNDYYNESYNRIIEDCNKLTGNYANVKKYLINKFKDIGSTEWGGLLFDQALLLPIKVLLKNDRWGQDRYGTNCISRPIDRNFDVDLSINIEKYNDIKNFKIVFILSQHSF